MSDRLRRLALEVADLIPRFDEHTEVYMIEDQEECVSSVGMIEYGSCRLYGEEDKGSPDSTGRHGSVIVQGQSVENLSDKAVQWVLARLLAAITTTGLASTAATQLLGGVQFDTDLVTGAEMRAADRIAEDWGFADAHRAWQREAFPSSQ